MSKHAEPHFQRLPNMYKKSPINIYMRDLRQKNKKLTETINKNNVVMIHTPLFYRHLIGRRQFYNST